MTDRGPKNRARGPQGAPVPPRTAESGSEIACDLLDLEAFDDVAFADIVVILERHAALVARLDLAHVVLEALELLEAAFVDHDVVAQEADLGAALHDAFRYHAAGDLAEPADGDHLADRTSVVTGKSVSVSVNLGGRR